MSVTKANIGNSSFVGAFAVPTDSYIVISQSATANDRKVIEEALEVKSIVSSIDGSDLVGVYAAGNSKGLLVPELASRTELMKLKKDLPGINVATFDTSLNALRNNILTNDKIALIDPEFSGKEAAKIADVLGVEVIKRRIGDFATIGANNILTNKGIVLNNSATEDDVDFAKSIFKNVSQSTASLGSSSIGLCSVANSKGVVVGISTTGFELARISEGLDLE